MKPIMEIRKTHEISSELCHTMTRACAEKQWINRDYYEAFRNILCDSLGLSRDVSDWEIEEAVESLHKEAKARKRQ